MQTSGTPPGSPYPGLRPFEAEEAHLFFGREQQVDALLERLHASRFVAVVGESGAGKSSLVRAGLLPALEAGFLAEAGSDWRFVVMRPGGAPLDVLTDTLLAPGILSDSGGKPEREFTGAELRRGPLGLVQLVKDAHLPAHTSLLLVVDQFEELFRYTTLSRKGEAEAFVELLLRSVSQREMPIYVVITMRSDFIGECARFRGLPEALNDNQFLTPRLTREQISLAIRGPARVFGGDVEDVLIAELANEVGDDPDQLPLLQHLLMRLWEQAVCRQPPSILTLALYRELGGFRAALNQHAEQVYMELTPESRTLAQRLFRCLCGSPGGRRDVRRPASMREVLAAADADMGRLVGVVEAFRGPGRHFLMPPSSVALGPDTQLDISHESLVRQWQRLGQWVDDEAANAREFLGLRDEAVRWKAGDGELILGRDLSRALDWRQRVNPTAAWAERYAPTVEYEAVMAYISESETEANRQRDERQAVLEREAAAATRLRGLSWVLGVLFVAAGLLFGYAWNAKQEADDQRNRVVAQKLVADAMAEIATDPGAALHTARDAVQANPSDSLADVTLRRAIGAYVPSDEYEGVPRSKNPDATGKFFLPFRVRADSFSPDGARVVLPLGYSAVVREIATGREVSKLTVREGQDGHNDIVGSASFSPDGRFIVTTSGDRSVRLWNAATGELQHALPHGAPINSATFDAKGESLLTASDMSEVGAGEVVVWDIASGQRKTLSPMVHEGDDVAYADFSPDGKWILSLTLKGKFTVRDAATGMQQHELDLSGGGDNDTYACDGHIRVKPVIASSPDRSTIAVLERYGKVTLLDAATLRPKPGELLKDRRFCSLAWNHDGARIAGACHDGAARVFNSSDGTLWREMPRRSDAVLSVAFDREDRLLTAGSDKVVRVWDLRKGKDEQLQMVQVTALRGHTELVSSAVFSPNGRHILSAADDKTARIWTLPGKDALRSYSEDGLSIKDAVFSADGLSLRILARPRTKPQVWQIRDVDPRKQGSLEGTVRTLPEKFVPQYLLGGGTHAWVVTPDGSAGLWHVDASRLNGSVVAESSSGKRKRVETLLSSDGNHVASFQEDVLVALNTLPGPNAAGPDAAQLQFKYDKSNGCGPRALSQEGRQIALTCNESEVRRYVRIWAPKEDADLMRLVLGDHIENAWFDPSGNRLAVSVKKEEREDRPVYIFDLTKARKREGAILIGHTDEINTIRFNKTGTMLVTSSDDGTVRVWDTRSGRQLSLVVPPEAPKSASFDPHERHILIQMEQSVAIVDCPVCGSTADIVAEADRLLRRTVEPAAPK